MTGDRDAMMRWLWSHRRLMCAGLALLLYLVGLGRPPLWEPDEGRYAEIAREMVAGRDYITPRNNFVPYLEKPPLVYWVTAASLTVLGHNEFAVRFQAVIASVGQVAIACALGERMFGPTAGVLSALALALSPLFFAFARFATPDPMLAFFLTAAMACFFIGAQSSELDERWILAAATMLALGTLTKGPVALLLGGAIALLWLMVEGRSRAVPGMTWLKSSVLYLGVTLPWFILVARRNSGFLHFFIIHEHFQRYLESTEHSWGPWFYLPITIAGTWPWFYFVPAGLVASTGPRPFLWLLGKKRSGSAATIGSEEDHVRAALRFLVVWFLVVLGFFSIPSSKLGEYILPALPPIAILAARGLAQIEKFTFTQRRWLFAIFAGINTGAAIAVTVAITVMPAQGLRHALVGATIVAAAALFAGGVTPLLFAGLEPITVALVLAISVIVMMVAGIDARERIAPLVSYRGLAESIAPYTDHGCRLTSYRHFEQALPFYTGVRETLVNYRGELEPFGPLHDPTGDIFATASQLKKAWAANRCVVLVANRSDIATLANLLSPAPTLIGCEGKKLALCNRPTESSAHAMRECVSTAAKDPRQAKPIGSRGLHL
jgi:4-amino-4-deoxy-L-arabinose transferase-like glycosyltransferase